MAERKVGVHRNLTQRINLAAWYRFRVGVNNIAGLASAWADASGNMRPLLQATASARPSILSDGSVLFNGTDQFMQATFTLIQPATIYLAFRQVSWTSGDVLFDGATGDVRVTQNTASPGLAANAGSGLTVSNTIPVGARGVMSFTVNGATSTYAAMGGAAAVLTTGDAGANNPGGITLGAGRSAANFANINVYEMIVYNVAHLGPVRHQIHRYLGRIASVGGI